MWRNNIQLLEYESSDEEEFLKHTVKIEDIQIDILINMILEIHLQDQPGTVDEIWGDLKFLKSNYKSFCDLVSKINEAVILLAPTSSGRLMPINSTYLTSLLGVNLKSLPFKIQEEKKSISLEDKSNVDPLHEVLSWELFFLNIGSIFPEISVTEFQKKLEKQENLPYLRQFVEYDEESVKIVEKILKKLSHDNLKCLSHLGIQCRHNENNDLKLPVNTTSLERLFENEIPCIDVPQYAETFAKKLGVSVEKNSISIIKVLKNLVLMKSTDTAKYIKWLVMLQDLMDENFKCNDVEIYLEDVFQKEKGFFRLDRIFCCDQIEGILDVCYYTNQTIINLEKNVEYFHLSKILGKLGCKTKFTLFDLTETLIEIVNDEKNFMVNRIIGHEGHMRFRSIYKALDDYIKNSKDDENKIKTEILKEMKFPLLQFDLNVISIQELHEREILVCKDYEVIKVINESVHSRVILIDCYNANDCPNLMKLLNVIYFDEISVMYLRHVNNNMEKENNNMNEIFCEVTKNPKFRVLKAKFLYFSLSFPQDFKTKLRDNHDSNDSGIRVDMHRSYAIIKNEYLICSESFSSNDEVKMYVSALKDILNSDEISENVIKKIKILFKIQIG